MNICRSTSARNYGSRLATRVLLRAGVSIALLVIVTRIGLAADPALQSADSSPDPSTLLSDEFRKPATSALIAIHQAKQNIAKVVTKNLPIGYYNPNLAAQAYDQVRQSQIAAQTDGDQQAATLLNSYFTKVRTWAEQYKAARQSMDATNTMAGPEMLADDSDWQAIESCEKAFNAMLDSRVYNAIASCE